MTTDTTGNILFNLFNFLPFIKEEILVIHSSSLRTFVKILI